MSWVLTILGIVVLIVLHELGHFTVAKAVGMRVERFSLFFPPKLLSVRRGETEYGIGAIPAGGYVKITGMAWEEMRNTDLRVAARAYALQAPWKRIVVILAGPGMNLLVAFALFCAVLLSSDISGKVTLEKLDPEVQAITTSTSVLGVGDRTPASHVLEPGDRILAVDGHRVTVASARAQIASHRCAGPLTEGCRAARPVRLSVRRGGRLLALSLYPRYSRQDGRMLIGFAFGSPKGYSVLPAAGGAAKAMWHVTTETLTGFVRALTNSKARHEVSSIVGITENVHTTVLAGAGEALVFLGFISLILAVINMFPFLPLDGGHVLWSLAEKVRGRRISLAGMYRFSSIGIVLLAFLVLNGLSNDISRLAS